MFVYLCLFIDGCSLNPLLGYSFIKQPTSNICGDWNKSTYGGTPPPIQLPSLPAFIVNSQTPWVCVCGYSSYMTKFCPHHSFTDPHRPETMILWPPLHLGVNTPVCCGQHTNLSQYYSLCSPSPLPRIPLPLSPLSAIPLVTVSMSLLLFYLILLFVLF